MQSDKSLGNVAEEMNSEFLKDCPYNHIRVGERRKKISVILEKLVIEQVEELRANSVTEFRRPIRQQIRLPMRLIKIERQECKKGYRIRSLILKSNWTSI